MSKFKPLSFALAMWSCSVHAQTVGVLDRAMSSREKIVAMNSAEDWITVHFENQIFLWREYGSNNESAIYSNSMPTAFWIDRNSGRIHQFHGFDTIDALIQLPTIAPKLPLLELIHSDEKLWNLWVSPTTSNPIGQWTSLTLESIEQQSELQSDALLRPSDPLTPGHAPSDRAVLDVICDRFAPPPDGVPDEGGDIPDENDDTKWHPAALASSPLFTLLQTLEYSICNPGPCDRCSNICCNLCCGTSARSCCRGRCSGLPFCCAGEACAGPCCNVPETCCPNEDWKCCSDHCCPKLVPKCCPLGCCQSTQICCGTGCCTPPLVCLSDGTHYACCNPGETLCNGQCCATTQTDVCCMDVCSAKGACCDFQSGSCEETHQLCCEANGRSYQGNGSLCVPGDLCRPKCDNCQTFTRVFDECFHWDNDPDGTPCWTDRCIHNVVNTAGCSSFPNRLGPPRCGAVLAFPLEPGAVQTALNGDCPGGIFIRHTFWEQITGCTSCGDPLPYKDGCLTQTCTGTFWNQAEPVFKFVCVDTCTEPSPQSEQVDLPHIPSMLTNEPSRFVTDDASELTFGMHSRTKPCIANTADGEDPSHSSLSKDSASRISEDVFSSMKFKDDALNEATFTFSVFSPTNMFTGKMERQRGFCKATLSEPEVGLSCEFIYESPLTYEPPGTGRYHPLSWDPSNGNLMVWRLVRYEALSAADINRVLSVSEHTTVSPRNERASGLGKPRVTELQIGDNERLYWWNHCLLAVGAGYSKRTQAHSSVSLGPERTRLTVPGAFGAKGVWHLLVEGGDENPLVREAHFFRDSIPERVNILAENTGHVTQGRLSLAESGSLTLDPGTEYVFTREFRILDICTEPDLQHLARLRRLLTDELPAGTTISRE